MLQLPQEYCLSGICPTAFGETCCKTIAHVKKTVCFQFPEIYLLNVAIFRFKTSNVLTFAARLGLLEKGQCNISTNHFGKNHILQPKGATLSGETFLNRHCAFQMHVGMCCSVPFSGNFVLKQTQFNFLQRLNSLKECGPP